MIKNRRIDNMSDFLNCSSGFEKEIQEITQSNPAPQKEDSSPMYNKVEKPLFYERQKSGRLHIQIRQDLIEKLLNTVFERKRDPKNRGASQRMVIEEALELFFKNETKSPTDKTQD